MHLSIDQQQTLELLELGSIRAPTSGGKVSKWCLLRGRSYPLKSLDLRGFHWVAIQRRCWKVALGVHSKAEAKLMLSCQTQVSGLVSARHTGESHQLSEALLTCYALKHFPILSVSLWQCEKMWTKWKIA